jgi:hypothetical protein
MNGGLLGKGFPAHYKDRPETREIATIQEGPGSVIGRRKILGKPRFWTAGPPNGMCHVKSKRSRKVAPFFANNHNEKVVKPVNV